MRKPTEGYRGVGFRSSDRERTGRLPCARVGGRPSSRSRTVRGRTVPVRYRRSGQSYRRSNASMSSRIDASSTPFSVSAYVTVGGEVSATRRSLRLGLFSERRSLRRGSRRDVPRPVQVGRPAGDPLELPVRHRGRLASARFPICMAGVGPQRPSVNGSRPSDTNSWQPTAIASYRSPGNIASPRTP